MYHKQTGCVPMISFVGGLIFAIFFLLVLLGLFSQTLRLSATINLSTFEWEHVYGVIMTILGFSFFSFFGVIFMELFPAVRVDKSGLYIKKVFTEDHFTWDEVKEVTNAKRLKNAKAVVLAPKGNWIKNYVRYYPYYIHGLIAGVSMEPTVILSEGQQHRDELLKEIGRQILNNIYSQNSLPLKQ